MQLDVPMYRRLRIRNKILVLSTLLLIVSLSIVGYANYYMSVRTISDMTEQELLNSAQRVVQQITLIWAIYTKNEVPMKLNYVIMSEKSAFKQHGYSVKTFILDDSGKHIKLQQKNLGDDFKNMGFTQEDYLNMKASRQGILKRSINGQRHTAAYFLVPDNQWLYIVVAKDSDFLAPVFAMRNFSITVGALALILAFFLSLAGASEISSPISRLVNYITKAEKGDLTVRAVAEKESPEIEGLYRSFNKMLENLEKLKPEGAGKENRRSINYGKTGSDRR